MYRKFHEPLAPLPLFFLHLLKAASLGLLLIGIALVIGMWGYHAFENMPWIDAFVNAAMILSGMGPLSQLTTVNGKLFAGFYAIFSGLFFILILGIMLGPVVHRLLHFWQLQKPKNGDSHF